MNTQFLEAPRTSTPTEQQTEKQSEQQQVARRLPPSALHPPNVLERIALRVGIALIVWGRRRAHFGPTREDLARRYTAIVARERFEREHERRWHLEGPRR